MSALALSVVRDEVSSSVESSFPSTLFSVCTCSHAVYHHSQYPFFSSSPLDNENVPLSPLSSAVPPLLTRLWFSSTSLTRALIDSRRSVHLRRRPHFPGSDLSRTVHCTPLLRLYPSPLSSLRRPLLLSHCPRSDSVRKSPRQSYNSLCPRCSPNTCLPTVRH